MPPLFYIAIFSGFLPLLALKLRFRKPSGLFFLEPFVWLIFISSVYEMVAVPFSWQAPYWFRIYALFEFLTLYYYFWLLLKKRYRCFFYGFLAVFLVLYVYLQCIWTYNDGYLTDSYLVAATTLFVICCAVLWYKGLFANLPDTPLLQSMHFYIVSALLVYFTGTVFLFLMSDYIFKNASEEMMSYWVLNYIFTIFVRVIIAMGIWKGQTK